MSTQILPEPRKTRPEATEPVDSVLDALADLYKRITHHENKEKENNMLEKYDYFCYHSERGRACTYAMKSKALFLMGDYPDVKKEIEKVVKAIRNIEEGFCRE